MFARHCSYDIIPQLFSMNPPPSCRCAHHGPSYQARLGCAEPIEASARAASSNTSRMTGFLLSSGPEATGAQESMWPCVWLLQALRLATLRFGRPAIARVLRAMAGALALDFGEAHF